MRRLVVRSLAESEIEQAYLWYADRSPDAARRFLDEIGSILGRILENSDQRNDGRADRDGRFAHAHSSEVG